MKPLGSRVRRVLAIVIIACVAVLPFIWNPWGTGQAQGAVDSPRNERIQHGLVPSKACPRDERCFFVRLAERFRAGRSGHSPRLVPPKIRKALNRKYKSAISKRAVDDWWNRPCEGTGWQCGGRYCQATKQYYATQQCLDKDWYRSRPLTYTNKVILVCGGSAILGAIGGRLDSGKIGWWGAGIGGGTCLYKSLAEKNGWSSP